MINHTNFGVPEYGGPITCTRTTAGGGRIYWTPVNDHLANMCPAVVVLLVVAMYILNKLKNSCAVWKQPETHRCISFLYQYGCAGNDSHYTAQ